MNRLNANDGTKRRKKPYEMLYFFICYRMRRLCTIKSVTVVASAIAWFFYGLQKKKEEIEGKKKKKTNVPDKI